MKSLLHSRAAGWKGRTGELWGKIIRYANADLSQDAGALDDAAGLPLNLGGVIGGFNHAIKQAPGEQKDVRTLLRWLAGDPGAERDGESIFSEHLSHVVIRFEKIGWPDAQKNLRINRIIESKHILDFVCSFVLEHGHWRTKESRFLLLPQSCPVGVCVRPGCGKFFVRVTRKTFCTRACTLLNLARPREESTMYQYARRARQMTVGTLERKIKDIKKKKIEPARRRWQLKILRKVLREKKPR